MLYEVDPVCKIFFKMIMHSKDAKEVYLALIAGLDKTLLPECIIKLRPEFFDEFRALLEFFITNDISIFDKPHLMIIMPLAACRYHHHL